MAKHSYEELTKTYQGFVLPTYSIVINKSDTINHNDSPAISTIEVELTAGYEASACNLFFYEGAEIIYQNNTYQVSQLYQEKFKLGNSIEVQLGYQTERKTVFKGIITGIELIYETGSAFQIRVESMDVKRLMMNNHRSYQPKNDLKTYSDAVKEVLKKYAANIEKQNVSDTFERALVIEQHNQSDYEFIVSLAKKANYTFYLVNNELFFQKLTEDTEPLLELNIKNLQSFNREISLGDQITEFTVRANDESDPNSVFESTAKDVDTIGKGTKASKDVTTLINENASKTIIDPSVSSANEAKARAEAELARHAFKFVHGSFKTFGIPEIVPGKLLTITGFGDEYDNDYYIKKVIHHYNSGGYYTKGELGVNKI